MICSMAEEYPFGSLRLLACAREAGDVEDSFCSSPQGMPLSGR